MEFCLGSEPQLRGRLPLIATIERIGQPLNGALVSLIFTNNLFIPSPPAQWMILKS